GEIALLVGDHRGRAQMVGVEVPVLPVRGDARILGEYADRAQEDVLEPVAQAAAAADVGEVLVGIEGGGAGVLALSGAGVVVDELGGIGALLLAGRVGHLLALVHAGEPILLVVDVVDDVGGAALGLADQVAVGIVDDVVGADRHRTVRLCAARARVGKGVV